jgi:hypothetical protein
MEIRQFLHNLHPQIGITPANTRYSDSWWGLSHNCAKNHAKAEILTEQRF